MKWIYWTVVVIIILAVLNEVNAGYRRKRSRNLKQRNKNALLRRALLKRKQLEALYASNDDDDDDDYYDSLDLGRNAPEEKKTEIKEEEIPTNTGTQATVAAGELGPEKIAVEGADSERLIGTGNNPVFTSFLTKKQNILNKFTTSTTTTTTVPPTTTTTSTIQVEGPIEIAPTTSNAPAPAPAVQASAPAFIQPATGGVVAQRIPGTGNRHVLVQYRPIVIQKVHRRGPNKHNRGRPVILQNQIAGGGNLAGGNIVRVPVRVQGG